MKKDLTCISCPLGCAITAEIQLDGSIAVTGNKCARGAQYAREELMDPRRVITATCRTTSAVHPRMPVRSREPCPRDLIPSILEKIYRMEVTLPVRQGDLLGAFHGVDILASRSLRE